ncbi:hypothetical protein [Spirosoma daeguense]
MKRLLFLLFLAASSLNSAPILAAASYSSVEVCADSIVPLNRVSTKKQKPEATAVWSLVAPGLGFFSKSSILLTVLGVLGFVLGVIAVVRIIRSKGQRKGLAAAGLGISLSIILLAFLYSLGG